MKAYKVFNKNLTCRGFQYEVGKTYELLDSNGKLLQPELCSRGFHACKKVSDCFSYYDFNPINRIAEVELSGVVLGDDQDKQCSNIITIVKELSWSEMLELANTGYRNSGYRNSGYSNSGNRNSGDMNSGNSNSGNSNSGNSNSGNSNSDNSNSGYSNSGNRNSGNRNSGDMNSGNSNSGNSNSGNSNSGNFNSCNFETGYFNSVYPTTINIFNKSCSIRLWDSAQKPDFIYNLILNQWIYFSDMSDQDKIDYPKAFVCNGYLKTFTYKEAWKNAFVQSTKEDIELLKVLPNFDKDVFFEISGIMVD